MARDEKIIVRLTEEIKEEFEQYAVSYGMTISALGSYVVGQWCANQRKQGPMMERITKAMVEQTGEIIKDDQFDLKGAVEKAAKIFMEEQAKKAVK